MNCKDCGHSSTKHFGHGGSCTVNGCYCSGWRATPLYDFLSHFVKEPNVEVVDSIEAVGSLYTDPTAFYIQAGRFLKELEEVYY